MNINCKFEQYLIESHLPAYIQVLIYLTTAGDTIQVKVPNKNYKPFFMSALKQANLGCKIQVDEAKNVIGLKCRDFIIYQTLPSTLYEDDNVDILNQNYLYNLFNNLFKVDNIKFENIFLITKVEEKNSKRRFKLILNEKNSYKTRLINDLHYFLITD